MFDLPEPLGPTTTLTPGPNSSRVRSGNDLKPFSVIDFRYTHPDHSSSSSAACAASCSASFLLRPDPRPASRP